MMQYRDLKKGDVVPLDYKRRPLAGEIEEAWFVMVVGRQRRDMLAASAWLTRNGASECWFPQETRRRTIKRQGREFREKIDVPIVPGIVFMLTSLQPQWDVLADRKGIRPLQIGTRPVCVSEAVLADMRVVPDRITEAARAAREARLALVPKPGEMAQITEGPLAGFVVRVQEMTGGEAIVLHERGKIHIDPAALERKS